MQMGVVMCPRQWDKYENFPHQLNCYMYETDTPLLLEMRHGKPASACLAIFPLVKTWVSRSVGGIESPNAFLLCLGSSNHDWQFSMEIYFHSCGTHNIPWAQGNLIDFHSNTFLYRPTNLATD